MNFPQASNFAPAVDRIIFALSGVCGAISLAVIVTLVVFAIRYRSGSAADRSDPPHRSPRAEALVVGAIFVFGMSTFAVSARLFYRMFVPPYRARTIYVTAKQWMWKFADAGGRSIDELTLTIGEPVRLVLISEDVVHSFFVPAFRVKEDVLPQRHTTLWFTPTRLGDFTVLCAQYCGLDHSEMRAVIHVVPEGGEKP